ncbi:effector-associated constant component EACC1 [Geodermatophilus sp. URMC 64]
MADAVARQLELRLVLQPEPGADAEEADRLSRQLRTELRELDVDDVRTVSDGAAPPGAKGDAASIGEWLLTLSAGGGVFTTVVATLRDWLGRRAGAHRIKLTIDEDTIELSAASDAERAELIEAFVRRHQPT